MVTGAGSQWTNSSALYVGRYGIGTLNISNDALVSVFGTLTIGTDFNDSFINMATGGMLAVYGDADNSLSQFFNLIYGTDAIRYWDAAVEDWAPLTSATFGTDYTLEYLTTGELAGYTLLTVGRAGDFDNDGDVDGRDFLASQRNPELGSYADWQNAYNGEGLVSALRLPPSALNVPVPEPSTWILAMALAMCIVHWHRN
jgi:T5SS/PEP-CTERM-associated repeat protein